MSRRTCTHKHTHTTTHTHTHTTTHTRFRKSSADSPRQTTYVCERVGWEHGHANRLAHLHHRLCLCVRQSAGRPYHRQLKARLQAAQVAVVVCPLYVQCGSTHDREPTAQPRCCSGTTIPACPSPRSMTLPASSCLAATSTALHSAASAAWAWSHPSYTCTWRRDHNTDERHTRTPNGLDTSSQRRTQWMPGDEPPCPARILQRRKWSDNVHAAPVTTALPYPLAQSVSGLRCARPVPAGLTAALEWRARHLDPCCRVDQW